MTLPAFLNQTGFHRIPLATNAVGYFHARGSLGGRSVAVVIDTGAAGSIVSLPVARELGLAMELVERREAGPGGASLEIFRLIDAPLTLDGIQLRVPVLAAMELTHINQSLARKGEAPIDVLLGADALDAHAGVIDYGSSSLFLRTSRDDQPSGLPAFLVRSGFHQVPLVRSRVGHFHAEGLLDGHSVSVTIDTGAASTVVSTALAQELDLAMTAVERKASGTVGADRDMFRLTDATFTLGDVRPRACELLAMDFSRVDRALAMKGEAAIEVVLGADALEADAAVIDYGSSSLFLLIP
jgi:predicted aspartyl protease